MPELHTNAPATGLDDHPADIPAAADRAAEQLAKVLGSEEAHSIVSRCLARAGRRVLRTPSDLVQFSDALIEHGGVAEAIGRAMKVRALLAKTPNEPRPRSRVS